MAEYYALLARAVGALQRNDEASRREIYVKARSALIRQLKAITPPLPPAEISKQRLALEEAIRRLEREAVEAASATMLSPDEIARRAEQALEEALAPGAEPEAEAAPQRQSFEPPPQRQTPPRQAPPTFEPAPERPQAQPSFEPLPQVEPEVISPRASAAEAAGRREDDFAEVVRPRTTDRGPRSAGWERAARVTDVEEPTRAPPPLERKGDDRASRRRGGRGWERSPKPHGRRSFGGFLAGVLLVVIVLGVGGYFIWQEYGDEITEFFGGTTGEETADVAEVVTETPAEGADGAAAEPAPAVVEEPPVFVETIGYLYTEPTTESPISDRYEASVAWSLVTEDSGAAVVTAQVGVPDQGLTITLRFELSSDPNYSHQVSALVRQSASFQDDPIEVIEKLAVKTTEESIGAALPGEILAEPDFFLLALRQSDVILNTNRLMQSPWFDLSIVYESGRRAIVAFNKGTAGDEVFAAARAAWAE